MNKYFKYGLIVASLLTLNQSHAKAETESAQGPDGRPIHETTCQGSSSSCYQEARATCKGNYQVLDSYSKAGNLFTDAIPGPFTWFHMSYSCGQSNGKIAKFNHEGGYYMPPRGFYSNCSGNYYNRSCGGWW